MRNETAKRSIWWIACGLLLVAYLATVPGLWQCEGVDEIEYLGLAHSLARGHGYTLNGEPYGVYPPLYPFILSLVMRQDVGAWRAMYSLNALAGALGLILGASWLRFRAGRAGVWAGWLALFSYYAWSFATRYLLTEPVFVLLSFVALLSAERVLERKQGALWEYAGIALGCLLCSTIRAGAVALLVTLTIAGLWRWITTRARAGLCVALLAVFLGGGFLAAWEVRSARVAPEATESYTRWALKFLGLSRETTGLIAESVGEGPARRMSWPERAVVSGVKTGQYLLSVVRPPPNFPPLALLMWAAVLTGVVVHLRRSAWSPIGWYALVSMLMITATSFLTSYLRYLWVLTPFLFFFAVLGWQTWHRALSVKPRLWWIAGAWGIASCLWGLWVGPPSGTGSEEKYMLLWWYACEGCYLGAAIAAFVSLRKKQEMLTGVARPAFALVLAGLFGFQAVGLAGLRYVKTRDNTTLKARNLEGAVRCAEFIRANSAAGSVCVSALPRLLVFLADRAAQAPAYSGNGDLDLAGVDYVIRIGRLVNVPQQRADDELRLQAALTAAVGSGKLEEQYAEGDAAVYGVMK